MKKFETISDPYKHMVLGLLAGLSAGISALIFESAIDFSTNFFLTWLVGLDLKSVYSGGEWFFKEVRWYFVPILLFGGGLFVGFIVKYFAREVGGHGTDVVIAAYHSGQKIPIKVPLLKMVTSAITLGSGGSAGKEGPMTQIAGSISSFLAEKMGFSERDRRIALAAGIGAGVGAIFKVPIGGAILSAEILYTQDLETDVLYSSLIASATGFVIFGFFKGFNPIFTVPTFEFNVLLLPFFVLEGLLCGFLGLIFIKIFFKVDDFFESLKIPLEAKPAIGGLLVGIIALIFPHVLGSGYVRIQNILLGIYEKGTLSLPLILVLLLLPFLKMFAAVLTLGSGGSGGVFAPGMVIGGFIGAFLGYILKTLMPHMVASEVPFVIVGMTSFLGLLVK